MLARGAMGLPRQAATAFTTIILLTAVHVSRGAATLDALGLYLTKNGYGGAQLIRLGKFYYLPISSNGKLANLIVDTGAPASLIFRSRLNELGLAESATNAPISSVFGTSPAFYGTATIKALTAGNCILTNVPVAVIPPLTDIHRYGDPGGALGLRELNKFGAVLDLPHRLIYFRPPQASFEMVPMGRLIQTRMGWKPAAPGSAVSQRIRSILTEEGWTPVPFAVVQRHLRVLAAVNGISCYLMVDTGASLTIIDADFAKRAQINVVPTRISAEGIGKSARDIALAPFVPLRVGSYQVKGFNATVGALDPAAIGRGTVSEIAGLLGIDYLIMNSAVFDFVARTMYLRPAAR